MIIYIDMVLFLNFIVDMLMLILTAFILKRKWKWYRIFIGALLGSCMVLFALSPISDIMSQPIVKIIFSIGIVLCAFKFTNFKLFIRTLCIFYFSTFVVGGGIVGLHYFFQSNITQSNGMVSTFSTGFGDPISWGFVCMMLPIMIYFSKKQIEEIEIRKIHYNELVKVEIKLEDKIIMINGLIDSGNSLCEPITQIPVMILDSYSSIDLIPKWILEKSKLEHKISFHITEQKLACFKRIRLIPYKVVGKNNQILIALKPDYVKIIQSNNEVIMAKALIGISPTKLSIENEFSCLLHPKMLQKTSMFSA